MGIKEGPSSDLDIFELKNTCKGVKPIHRYKFGTAVSQVIVGLLEIPILYFFLDFLIDIGIYELLQSEVLVNTVTVSDHMVQMVRDGKAEFSNLSLLLSLEITLVFPRQNTHNVGDVGTSLFQRRILIRETY